MRRSPHDISAQARYFGWHYGSEELGMLGARPCIATIAVKNLEEARVVEHYDLPGTTVEGDVHVEGDRKAVWFKDSDGNVLSIVNEAME